MDEHLFRREALEHRSTPAFGSVFLIQPPSFIVLTMIACAAVTALVVFLCVGQFARKETAQGYLVPDKGLVKIMPPFAGTVIERRVDEGDVVKAGDLLFLVSDNRGTRTTPDIARALLTEAQKQRDAFRKQFEQARRAGELEMEMLEQEVAGLKEELNQADQELMTQKKRLELSRESLQVYRNLASHGHLPRQQLLDYEREHLEFAALIDGIERNRASLLRQHKTTRAKISIAAIETASRLADYEGRIAEIDQRIAELDSRAGFAIRAPVAGIVTNIRLEPGETVS